MKFRFFLLLILLSSNIIAQEYIPHKSIHQIESEKHRKFKFTTEKEWNDYSGFKKMNTPKQEKTEMNKIVFGWHPYWGGSDYLNYQWAYLTDIAYFDYQVDPSDGSAITMHNWESSPVVDLAHENGVRVHLTATLFGNHDDFFSNSTAQQNLIDNLVAQVISRDAIGINIDFEGMGADNTDDFTQFMSNLSSTFKSQVPDGILSVCLYAVDWHGVFDIPALENSVDLYTIMGYDYYYSGSSEAGPTGQLYTFNGFNYTQSRTISYYLHEGATPEKLILGVPYFGFEWQTEDDNVPSNTIDYISARTIEVVKNNENGFYSNPQIDPNSLGNHYIFQDNGNWYQTWIEDETTLKYSYKLVNQIGIGGVAIWALSYDNGHTEMWELLRDYFSECAEVPLVDTIWDLGGPTRNHFNYENFVYTIKPTRGTDLTLTFSDFELEEDYDSLYIYDGESVNAPLIGGFSGTNSPGIINATGNALTLEFFSDVATVRQGWTAIWNSTPDSENPETQIIAPDWNSQNFTADFTDSDNLGVKNKFYQIADFDGEEWRSNSDFGYLNDNFDEVSINSEWNQISGSWSISNGKLLQSDDLNNTNIYIDANQEQGNIYLYEWEMKLSGVEDNRRGGIHFFCDDATMENRNNSYFVYFRADQNTAQIYKCVDDVFELETTDECNIDINIFYNYKIIFNSGTGEILAFKNDELVTKWIDYNPHNSGNSVSLRIGNAIAEIDNFKMYKSRTDSEIITIGDENSEIRYENTNNSTPVGKISSIVVDFNDNFSEETEKLINIDFSPPSEVSVLNDGIAEDLDETNAISQLSANWQPATDDNSGIAAYWYAVGSSPLADDIYNWTRGNAQTNATIVGLDLEYDNTYYFSVKAENLAGLLGDAISSDGITVIFANEPPTANFTISDNEICQGDTVEFYYTGLNAQEFLWTFEGVEIENSSLMNPQVVYNQAGEFDVKLKVTNYLGEDSLTIENAILVHQLPEVDFEATPIYGGLPLLVNFINNSSQDGISYFWDFGDGNTYENSIFEETIQHLYVTTGIFTVGLTVENESCTNELSYEDFISVDLTNIYELNDDFEIYPNPVHDVLYIKNKFQNNFKTEIINMNGEVIFVSENQNEINTINIQTGVYILKIESENKFYIEKIIIE